MSPGITNALWLVKVTESAGKQSWHEADSLEGATRVAKRLSAHWCWASVFAYQTVVVPGEMGISRWAQVAIYCNGHQRAAARSASA
jgi:hypothetical protein